MFLSNSAKKFGWVAALASPTKLSSGSWSLRYLGFGSVQGLLFLFKIRGLSSILVGVGESNSPPGRYPSSTNRPT